MLPPLALRWHGHNGNSLFFQQACLGDLNSFLAPIVAKPNKHLIYQFDCLLCLNVQSTYFKASKKSTQCELKAAGREYAVMVVPVILTAAHAAVSRQGGGKIYITWPLLLNLRVGMVAARSKISTWIWQRTGPGAESRRAFIFYLVRRCSLTGMMSAVT